MAGEGKILGLAGLSVVGLIAMQAIRYAYWHIDLPDHIVADINAVNAENGVDWSHDEAMVSPAARLEEIKGLITDIDKMLAQLDKLQADVAADPEVATRNTRYLDAMEKSEVELRDRRNALLDALQHPDDVMSVSAKDWWLFRDSVRSYENDIASAARWLK